MNLHDFRRLAFRRRNSAERQRRDERWIWWRRRRRRDHRIDLERVYMASAYFSSSPLFCRLAQLFNALRKVRIGIEAGGCASLRRTPVRSTSNDRQFLFRWLHLQFRCGTRTISFARAHLFHSFFVRDVATADDKSYRASGETSLSEDATRRLVTIIPSCPVSLNSVRLISERIIHIFVSAWEMSLTWLNL